MVTEPHEFGELAAEMDGAGVRFIITRIGEDGAEIMAAVDMDWPAAHKLAYSLLQDGPER